MISLKLAVALGALILGAALGDAAGAEEQPPPAQPPYLLVQQQPGILIMMSISERRTTDVGASTTMILFKGDGSHTQSDLAVSVIRSQMRVEVDCARKLIRNGTMFHYYHLARDYLEGRATETPPTGWESFSDEWLPGLALDSPTGQFLCGAGQVDPARVRSDIVSAVADWLRNPVTLE